MDYYKAALIVANTIKAGGADTLTDEQFTLMAGAVGVVMDAAVTEERAACAKIIEGAAIGFCGGRAEIVMNTIATSIRER